MRNQTACNRPWTNASLIVFFCFWIASGVIFGLSFAQMLVSVASSRMVLRSCSISRSSCILSCDQFCESSRQLRMTHRHLRSSRGRRPSSRFHFLVRQYRRSLLSGSSLAFIDLIWLASCRPSLCPHTGRFCIDFL